MDEQMSLPVTPSPIASLQPRLEPEPIREQVTTPPEHIVEEEPSYMVEESIKDFGPTFEGSDKEQGPSYSERYVHEV
ncbi:unnamed protein product [Strongylus vulgaris]|uniref:Uncharacterized protein n=1 Tax=Strongylus vulgaris TaxID=40348 RepID=A0A3P7KCL9_STRVU|nr:unnamed protein product [Strongylus vulgaris]